MKLNKKGMTLVELLVSISLISIVLLLLFSLMNDLNGETKNNDFAYENQVNRLEIINTIQKDLYRYSLVNILNNSTSSGINIAFYYDIQNSDNSNFKCTSDDKITHGGKTYIKTVLKTSKSIVDNKDKYFLEYNDVYCNKYSWELKGAIPDFNPDFDFSKTKDDAYYFILRIKIYSDSEKNNSTNNNIIDDIELSYYNPDVESIVEFSPEVLLTK